MVNKFDVPNMICAAQKEALRKQEELSAGLYAPGQSLEEMRKGYEKERKWWNEGGPQPVSTSNFVVNTRHGEIAVRCHRGSAAAKLPAIIYIHGGGFALGSIDTHDRITRVLADETGAAVFNVNYSLSPEAKYPQPVEECVDVVEYLRAQAATLDIDGDDISFAGDSGGANLSFATYIYLRDQQKHQGIRAMLLFYGVYGLRDSVSMRLFGGAWDGLTAEDYDMYKNYYFANKADERDKYFDILSNDLTRDVPAAFIAAAEFDPLKDESKALAEIYRYFGNPYEYVEVPGVLHAFIHFGRILPATNETLSQASKFFLTAKTN